MTWTEPINSLPGGSSNVRKFVRSNTDDGAISIMKLLHSDGQSALKLIVDVWETKCCKQLRARTVVKRVKVYVIDKDSGGVGQ